MAETALTFGPDWIRAYSAGAAASNAANPTTTMPPPKYSLAEFRYGREEMLALIPKDVKIPTCLKDFPHLFRERFQIPLALIPMTEEDQRLWTRVNSEAALRASGKSMGGMVRTGRGGSVDRGRGRGRGGYYQRGLIHDDDDGGLHGFSRPKQVERSLSSNERDLRWDDRDRRYDRPYSGRGNGDDGFLKQDNTRGPHDYWRKYDKDDEGDWRSSGSRSSDRIGGRGSWRNNSERDRQNILDRNPHNRNVNPNSKSGPSPLKNHSWKETSSSSHLPEWSVEETNETDTVGTFDSSGAFLETKSTDDASLDEIYISDSADEGSSKESPEASKKSIKKQPKSMPNSSDNKPSSKKKTDNTSNQNSSELSKSNSKNSKPVVEKSACDVIRTKSDAQLQQLQSTEKCDLSNVNSNVPDRSLKSNKVEDSAVLSNLRNSENATPTSGTAEDDAFAHLKKATENMVAQWTEEEEQQAISHTVDIHPPHEKETKWFYQDPQGDIQGPFASTEMLEWFTSGYFTVNLMVRRNCDETFSKLGDLINAWGRVPFFPGNLPPPIRAPHVPSIPPPVPQSSLPNPTATPTPAQLPKQEDLLALQRQIYQQQLMQQQLIMRQQAQMQALLSQLKQQDNFSSLSSQQQQQVLLQQFVSQQQMTSRPNVNPLADQPPMMDPLSTLPLPLLGMSVPPMMGDMNLWNTSGSGVWPMKLNTPQPPGASIWDADLLKPNSENSEAEKKKKQAEEQEILRKAEELRLEQERELEEKRLQEELKRKQEETKRLLELQKQEEERRLEKLKIQQEEERKRQEELRILEEKRRQEELKRLEELEKEELRKQELRIQEELRRQEELIKQEELRMQEELKRMEELRKQEEQRQLEEQRRQEEIRKQQEEKHRKEEALKEEKRKQIEREEEKRMELERQKDALRLKEYEREERYLSEKRQREQLELMKLAELKLRTSQGPAWGIQNSQPLTELSLADIQRLQEEKEREERLEKQRQQSVQQQVVKQVQQSKTSLSWAKRATDNEPAVKSLIEIQQEEAERLSKMQRTQKPQPPPPTLSSNAGVWGNSSHLNKITAAPQTWNTPSNVSSATGFWDDVISNNSHSRKQPQKTNETSAFPALANRGQPATVNNNKSKTVRAKKDEDAVTRLFGSHHKPTDEFTKWCTDAISSMPSSVDVPTFVAFLKDIESPYEVYDYVKSYLGEGKEPREFAKQFIEKRSKYRNQAKQAPTEENTLWGPAPAITPVVNKTVVQTFNDCDGNSNAKGRAKKKKNRMQKLDSSMLGFTVQSNPDRVNVGEIDHIDGV